MSLKKDYLALITYFCFVKTSSKSADYIKPAP